MAATLTLLTFALPWLGALLVWLSGDAQPKRQHILAIASAAAGGIASLGLLFYATDTAVISIPLGVSFGVLTFVPDGLGTLLSAIASIIGCLTVVFSVDYMRGEAQPGRYYALVLIFIGAMCGLVLTDSLLVMFIFWEITALCSYALISFDNDNPKAVAGGIQALIMTQIGGVGLLAAALIAYGTLGSTSVSLLLAQAATLPPALLAIMAFGVLIAAAAKSAQVPFHTWLPGAMEAPSPISALIHAATMVNAGVYLLARLYPAFADVPYWATAVIAVGVASALLGGLMAAASDDLKRALAYSTISQLGIMVYAVGVGASFAAPFHLLNHAVFKALLFLAAGAVIHAAGTRELEKLRGAGRMMPLVRIAFIIGALALVGVPITNGFWSKEMVLEAGLEHGPVWAYIGILLSVAITAFYALRLVVKVFFTEGEWVWPLHDASPTMRLPLIVLAVGALTTWLLAAPLGASLAASMPYHDVPHITLAEMIVHALQPGVLIALSVIASGLLAYPLRRPLSVIGVLLTPLTRAARADFGFDGVMRGMASLVSGTALAALRTETGQINWNIAGIAGALLAILGILAWSTLR
jgi:NADH-quinone oxidoreductase subunit L